MTKFMPRYVPGYLITASALIAVLAAAPASLPQQDTGPILKPNKPPAKPSTATILVVCDLACNLKLDGETKGTLDAGGSKKVPVSLGQHLVNATTTDGLDKVEQEVDLKTPAQTIVRLQLQPLRDARLKAEQEAREQKQKNTAAQAQQGKTPDKDPVRNDFQVMGNVCSQP